MKVCNDDNWKKGKTCPIQLLCTRKFKALQTKQKTMERGQNMILRIKNGFISGKPGRT